VTIASLSVRSNGLGGTDSEDTDVDGTIQIGRSPVAVRVEPWSL
jgi:hypothetical protein